MHFAKQVYINEGRNVAALVCVLLGSILLLLTGTMAQPAATEPPLLRMVAWQNEGDRMPSASVDLLAAYYRTNPGVVVNLSFERWPQAYQRLKYWCGSLQAYAPAFTIMKDTWLPQFANAILPLDDLLAPSDVAGILPSTLNRCRYNGKLLGLPWSGATRVLYYRKDLLEAAKLKPPTTLAELQKVALELSKPPALYGVGLPAAAGGGGTDAYLGLLWAYGGSTVDKNGKLDLRNEEGAQALQYWVDLLRSGAAQPEALSWSSAELDRAFADGKLAMVFSGPALGQYLKRYRPELQFATSPLPGAKQMPAQISCDVLVVLKGTPQSAQCAPFLKYIASAEAQRALWQMGALPTYRKFAEQARQDPAQRAFAERLEEADGVPLQDTERLTRIIERALWLALSGRSEPAEALPTATREDDSLTAEGLL